MAAEVGASPSLRFPAIAPLPLCTALLLHVVPHVLPHVPLRTALLLHVLPHVLPHVPLCTALLPVDAITPQCAALLPHTKGDGPRRTPRCLSSARCVQSEVWDLRPLFRKVRTSGGVGPEASLPHGAYNRT